jgi:RHS repeat-associated protein
MRAWVVTLIRLAFILGFPTFAAAQVPSAHPTPPHPRPFACVPGQCPPNPITIQFSQGSETDLNTTLSEIITICTTPNNPGSDSAYFNGTLLSGFSLGSNNCENLTTPTETLVAGTNTFRVRGCSDTTTLFEGQCVVQIATITHPSVTMGPKGTAAPLTARTNGTQKFGVSNNMNVSQTFTLTVTCTGSGVANCSAPSSVTVPATTTDTVTVTEGVTDTLNATGIIQLKASVSGAADSGWYDYTVLGHMTVSTAYTNQDDQDYGRCASSCFAATASRTTVPYISRNAGRGVTLVYNGDRVAVRPVVYADVTMASGAPSVTKFQLQAQVHGTWATFTNGETTLNFSGSPVNGSVKPFRLAGAINVDATLPANYPSGAYDMQLVVTALYSDGHTEQVIDTTHTLTVVNTRSSTVGRGWTIAGMPMVYYHFLANGNVDALKQVSASGNGSAVMYTTTNGCLPVCVPNLPAGVFTTQTLQLDAHGNFQGVRLISPDSSFFFYQAGSLNGHGASAWISRTQADTISFVATDTSVSARTVTISDPQRIFNGAHTYITLQYDGNNHLSKIVEPRGTDNKPDSGRVTLVSIDANGFLRTWTDPDGDSTKFGYDSLGRLDSLVDRNRNVTTYTYEPIVSKLTSISSPLVALDFHSTDTLATIHLVTTYQPWQVVGVPTSLTSSTPWTPVEADTVEGVVTTTSGDTSRFTVDRWGQPLVVTGNDTIRTKYGRDVNGFTISVTRPIGAHDTASYSGPFLTMTQPAGQGATNYTYGAFGQVTSIYGPNIPTQTFHLGSRGHVDSSTVNGSRTQFFPNALLRDTSMVDAAGDTTRYHYESFTGNTDTVSSLARSATQTSYRYTSKRFDRYGRDSVVRTSGTGSPTVVTTTLYDLLNRPDSVFDGVHSLPTIYHRDGINVTQLTDSKGQVYTTTYNALNLPVTQTDPTNRTVATTYTSSLQLATVMNRRGQLTKYTYDNLFRLSHVHRPPNRTGELDTLEIITTSRLGDTVNAWNPVTREFFYRSQATGYPDSALTIYLFEGNRSFKRNFFYDSRGRVDSIAITPSSNVTGIDPYARAYHYSDTTGLLTSVATGTASVGFRYDALFRPDTITYTGGSVTRNDAYTSIGTVSTTTWNGLNLYRGYGYDSTGRVIEVDHGVSGLPTPDSVEFYNYDPLGELTQHIIGKWSDSLHTCGNNQLSGNGCSAGEQRTYTTLAQGNFVWDSAGNLDSLKVGSADTAATLLTGNRLAAWTGLTFTGDSDGNRTSTSAGPQYTWSSDGRLLSVVSGSTTRVYDYDNFGQLARRTTNGTVDRYYLWGGGQLLAILDSAANTRVAEFAYNPGSVDLPLVRITGPKGSSSVHFYARDGMGNIIGQFSGSTLEQGLQYDPWGAARITTTTGDTTQLRWKGLLYEDGVTSLYYVRARWYDPVTRRFISPDPSGLSAGINQYAFAGGDPINGSDPSGMLCEDPDSGGDCPLEGGGGGGGGGGGFGTTAGALSSAFAGVTCSILLPCNNNDILSGIPGSSTYVNPFPSSSSFVPSAFAAYLPSSYYVGNLGVASLTVADASDLIGPPDDWQRAFWGACLALSCMMDPPVPPGSGMGPPNAPENPAVPPTQDPSSTECIVIIQTCGNEEPWPPTSSAKVSPGFVGGLGVVVTAVVAYWWLIFAF